MRLIELLAAAFGWTIRMLVLTAGPCLIVYGVWLFSHRVAYVVAGVMLVLLNLGPSKGGK